ncbi:transposase [Streptomyces sp. NBC_00457]|uniref:Tn3 family transposase n=1 Tax=Streptomyces sp. NBC_00457 TaxID=2975748 RepID=UPI002E1EB553
MLIYWHVEKKSLAIHYQLINCAASEVAAMVEGAMQHGTSMVVEANYTDSHGQSDVGFGITRMLNFDLLPKIKRINMPVAGPRRHLAWRDTGTWLPRARAWATVLVSPAWWRLSGAGHVTLRSRTRHALRSRGGHRLGLTARFEPFAAD